MTAIIDTQPSPVWENSTTGWGLLALAIISLVAAFYPGLVKMIQLWNTFEEYSYAWFIVPIVVFLIWQKSIELRQAELEGTWHGLIFVLLAAIMCIAGRLSLVRLLLQYGFVMGLFGVSLCAIGWRGVRLIAIPLAFLLLMIPLPHFVFYEITQQLQLLSSQLGVALIRACDISVFLEGNVIDLGSYKLQVAEACSGLRYLFPLIALGCLAAYFFRAAMWKRILVLLSTLPLTVIINSVRIGLIGVTVEYWGPSMAEGVLHQFEGWFMFMICLGLLLSEMALLAAIGQRSKTLRSTFGFDFPTAPPEHTPVLIRKTSRPLQAAAVLVAAFSVFTLLVPMRSEVVPQRQSFASYPLQLPGGWVGRTGRLDDDIIATLELDDYLLVDYFDSAGHTINYYIAYYATQTGAEKASHSPRTCIPGGGWTITDFKQIAIPLKNGTLQPANRAIIERGGQRSLVYYWFKQRGRLLTNEWLVKWYIFHDSIARGRTDGALVRLVTPVPRGTSVEAADHILANFIRTTDPTISAYVPD